MFRNKGFASLALIVIILVLAGAAGYFVLVHNQRVSTPASVPTPAQTSALTPTAVTTPLSSTPAVTGDTTNWKTYRNEKYGFEMKYPNDWDMKISETKPSKPVMQTYPDYLRSLGLVFSSSRRSQPAIGVDVDDIRWSIPYTYTGVPGGGSCKEGGWHIV